MFKNHEEYMKLRNDLLAAAQSAMEAGDNEAFETKTGEIEELDLAWEQFAQRQADLNALKGAAKAPATMKQDTNIGMDADMEYRKSFMNYVMKGIPMRNTDASTTTSDVGPVIPVTVLNRIVELMETNGNILNKVTRTAYKGGVKVPASAAKPTAAWVAERADVDTQKKEITADIVFSYYKLKVKVAVSLIVENVTMDVFERTLASNIAEAMVRALEDAIINGTGSGQPKGILKETPMDHVDVDVADGVTYPDLLACEAALPVAYESKAEWVMHKKFFFSNILAMVDSNGHPIARVDHGISGKPEYTILGRNVNLTDHMPIPTTSAPTGTFAFLADLSNYMVNTNMNVTVSRYVDEETDDTVTKAVMIADGKMIDTNGLVFLNLVSD